MTIKAMQARLSAAGFDCGVADGHVGPKTIAALMGYLAKRQPDAAIRGRAAALAAIWLPRSDRNPEGWTRLRLIHFLAQLCHETGGWRVFQENLNYRDPARLNALFSAVRGLADAKALIAKGPQAIANRVYANRLGNGPEASGDGWRYRGQGDTQITGKDNYRLYGGLIGIDLVASPERALEPEISIRLALAYWLRNSCNSWADQDNVARITKLINGPALAGLEDRRRLVVFGKAVWAV